MSDIVSPVILVPGITASVLHDEYELPPEAVWTTVFRRRYERITLHPRDRRYELREPARVAPGGPFPLVYEDLVEELRDGLGDDRQRPVPVFPFGYDWRMPLERTEERLAAFVEEVVDRTLLMPHYRADRRYRERPAVSLIGHSMGGLIIAGYLQRCPGRRVDRVITLGSPFRGSFEAVLKIVTGTGDFGDDTGKARERQSARLTPALYHLLPAFEGMDMDLFDPDAWQPSVLRTIDEHVRGFDVAGHEVFSAMLREAREHRERISRLELGETTVGADRWLAIAGVGAETRVGLRVARDSGAPRFVLSSAERCDRWDEPDAKARMKTGDGTVPLIGALAPFLDPSRLVCVTPRDFGYWELRDRALAGMAGFHGTLPTMNMLHRLIIRFLRGTEDRYGSTWGRRVPGVERWNPPLELREKDRFRR